MLTSLSPGCDTAFKACNNPRLILENDLVSTISVMSPILFVCYFFHWRESLSIENYVSVKERLSNSY